MLGSKWSYVPLNIIRIHITFFTVDGCCSSWTSAVPAQLLPTLRTTPTSDLFLRRSSMPLDRKLKMSLILNMTRKSGCHSVNHGKIHLVRKFDIHTHSSDDLFLSPFHPSSPILNLPIIPSVIPPLCRTLCLLISNLSHSSYLNPPYTFPLFSSICPTLSRNNLVFDCQFIDINRCNANIQTLNLVTDFIVNMNKGADKYTGLSLFL